MMVRAAVALYLAVVTVAGPWLCCCPFARATPTQTADAPAAPSPAPCCPNCCHQDDDPPPPADPTTGPESGLASAPHRSDAPPCPCREVKARTAALTPAKTESDGEHEPDFPKAPAFHATDPIRPDSTSARPGLADGAVMPFLTADDLLFSFHLLRC